MNRPSWLVANFVAFLIAVMLACALQTSLFHWVFTWRPTIQIALVFMVYVALYRGTAEALLFMVLSCYITGILSVMMTSINIFSGIVIFLLLRGLRTRVYSSSPVYFTWTALAAILTFHIISWITSLIFEGRTPSARPLDWILEVLITALFTRMLYSFCLWLDRKTKRLSLTELNS